MRDAFESRGVEKTEFEDPRTGRTVLQLTNGPMMDLHTYYDICPWSADGRYIVFSSAHREDLTLPYPGGCLASDKGRVFVLDTGTFEMRQIAERAYFNTHGGAFCMWHPRDPKVYYRASAEQMEVLNVETGERRRLDGLARQLSPDGKRFVTVVRASADEQGSGIALRGEDGGEARQILSREQLYELTPNRDRFEVKEMSLGNTKWSPDGRHILIAMWVHPKPEVHRSLYVCRADGSEPRWLTHFGHHHSWTPDGARVLLNDWLTFTQEGERKDPRMFLVDLNGGNRRVVIDKPIGSHPLMHPSGQYIVDWDRKGVYLVHVDRGVRERLVFYRGEFLMSHKGAHPHTVWNREGTQILYNSAETGRSELYLLHL